MSGVFPAHSSQRPERIARVGAAFGNLEQDAESGVWGFGDAADGYFTEDPASGVLGIDTEASAHDVRVVFPNERAALIY